MGASARHADAGALRVRVLRLGLDSDGYGNPPGPGCGAIPDCAPLDSTINPGVLEVPGNAVDENCNFRTGMKIVETQPDFPTFGMHPWAHTAATNTADGVQINGGGSISRADFSIGLPMAVGVALGVTSSTGPGNCRVTIGTAPMGANSPISLAPSPTIPPGSGRKFLDVSGLIPAGVTLRSLAVSCPLGDSLELDWLQIQDADVDFPPPSELVLDWQDGRMPGGGATTTIVRDDGGNWLYTGSDVGGVARYDWSSGGPWQTANGDPQHSLMRAGNTGVWDILAMENGTGDLYALLGDNDIGGLWHSADNGDTWYEIGNSWSDASDPNHYNPQSGSLNDVMGWGTADQCDGAWYSPTGVPSQRTFAGGRLLQGDDRVPLVGDTVYIANADPQQIGVSIYDGNHVCPLPNVGTPLPAEPIGAILRFDALPFGSPMLAVGYRGRPDNAPGVYLCALPVVGHVNCAGLAPADCQPVDGSEGIDVRDLEVDDARAQIEPELGNLPTSGLLVADGGVRPGTPTVEDGLITQYASCASGAAQTGVWELTTDDSAGTPNLDAWIDRLLDPADLSNPLDSVTGVSENPLLDYVFVNLSVGPNENYAVDRMFRVDAAELVARFEGDPTAAPIAESLNSAGPSPDYHDEDDYEYIRRAFDTDFSDAWLETTISGRADPFAARSEPGYSIDTTWMLYSLYISPGVALLREYGVVNGGTEMWLVEHATEPWTDDELDGDGVAEPEGDVEFTFWPDLDPGHATYSSLAAWAAAVSPDGMRWTTAGDVGILQTDLTDPTEAGAQIDCTWHGWHAAARGVSVAPDGSVWAAVTDEAGYGDAGIGIVRTLDAGATWNYAGGGYLGAGNGDNLNVDLLSPGDIDYLGHACVDLLGAVPAPQHGRVLPFGNNPNAGTAFNLSTTHPHEIFDNQNAGHPVEVEALGRGSAVAMFTRVSDDEPGGLYLTVDGGESWAPIPFEGAWSGSGVAGTCDEATTWTNARFHILHPGGDSYWTGSEYGEFLPDPAVEGGGVMVHHFSADDWHYELIVGVLGAPDGPADASIGSYTSTPGDVDASTPEREYCALARVSVEDSGLGVVGATWTWLPLTKYSAPFSPNSCGVSADNLVGFQVAPWSDDVAIWGNYSRFTPNMMRWGGACTYSLIDGSLNLLVDPTQREYSIGAVAPHPEIADLYAVMPTMDNGAWSQCQLREDATVEVCPDAPLPLLLWNNGGGWTTRELPDMPPSARISNARWSDVGVTGVGTGTESWLAVATAGSGTWLGKVAW